MLDTLLTIPPRFRSSWLGLTMIGILLAVGGCATIRVTDPPRTADEEFLLSEAARRCVAQLNVDPLRDRLVWVETSYVLSTTQPYQQSFLTNEILVPQFEQAYLVAELRARLLQSGVRLAQSKEQAQVILEMRSGGLSINRLDFNLGVPAVYIPGSSNSSISSVVLSTPDLSLFKSVKQHGYGSVAFVAYWKDTGELLSVSGPFVGRSYRNDYFIFGFALPTIGDIPPTEPMPSENKTAPTPTAK